MAQEFGLALLFMDSHGVSPEVVHRSEMGLLILGWPKSLFRFLHTILQKNPNELFGQPKSVYMDFLKNLPANMGDMGLFPGSGRSTGEKNSNSL